MIRMTVGVDDIADRLFGAGTDRREQSPSLAYAAAGIDHSDRIVADDEADIGGRSLVFACHEFSHADVNENARRDFADR